MNSKNLRLVGAILMAASLILLAIGGYRFLINLPESDELITNPELEEKAMAAAERSLAGRKDHFGRSLMGPSAMRLVALEMQLAKLEILSRNGHREGEREKALQLLIPGVVVLLAGGVCFGIAAKKRKSPSGAPTEL